VAKPSCGTLFRYFRGGKIFLVERIQSSDPDSVFFTRRIEYEKNAQRIFFVVRTMLQERDDHF
jgi:hypothetical protein